MSIKKLLKMRKMVLLSLIYSFHPQIKQFMENLLIIGSIDFIFLIKMIKTIQLT